RCPRVCSTTPPVTAITGTASARIANHRSTAARSISSRIVALSTTKTRRTRGDTQWFILVPLCRGPRFSRRAGAAREHDLAGAHQLRDPERLQHPLQSVDLLRVAGALDNKGPLADIDDLGAEDVADLHDLGAALRLGVDLDQGQLAGDARCLG